MGCCGCLSKNKGKASRGLSRKEGKNDVAISQVEAALCELRETEITYGEALQYMVDKHLEALRTEATFFDQTELIAFNSLFLDLNIAQKEFMKKLTKFIVGPTKATFEDNLPEVICNVSDLFIEAEKGYFQMYGRYVMVMSKVQKVISKENGIEKIANFLEAKHNESVTGDVPKEFHILTMESILTKPFQRMLLYPLIFERFEKKCEDGTTEKEKAQKAMEGLRRIADIMTKYTEDNETNKADYQKMLNEYGILEYKK
ncbi:Protein still life, isoform SIF type 1 [Orchesella cincta]|uniref:Protein still life, isoform SIF type 1 n=1 Tax=Orchesella cincta TaxID=48709 RepID=A0A1D2MTK4_ORCCI|nr:Protein still life, isoform SIF type 1 [Orchesella cincta]